MSYNQDDQHWAQALPLKIKEILFGLYPKSRHIPVLYGGSVKPKNAKNLIKVPACAIEYNRRCHRIF